MYDDVLIAVAIISMVVYIAIGCVFGAICRKIIEDKGYSSQENHGFAWGFGLGVIGFIVCSTKPDMNNTPNMNGSVGGNATDALLKLSKLLEMGAITQEEFDEQKEKLMKVM